MAGRVSAQGGCEVSVPNRRWLFLQRNAPEEKASVGPWLLALFIFVVCGSGKCRCWLQLGEVRFFPGN